MIFSGGLQLCSGEGRLLLANLLPASRAGASQTLLSMATVCLPLADTCVI